MSKKDTDNTLHIYTRVSTTSQSEKGMSLINQRERGIEVSKSLGMDYQIWNEGGKSSFSDDLLNRPILMSLCDGWKDGSVKNVYVTDFDRLSRKGTSWYIILRDIEKYGINVYVSSGTKYDISNEYDKLMLTIVSGVSQFDNTQRTRRFQQNKIRKFCEGYYIHGTTVFGFEKYVVDKGKKLKEHSEYGKVVRQLFNMFSKGKTIKELQTYLLKEKVKSPRNNVEWGQQQLLNLLRNKHYIGETVYTDKRSGKVYKGKCPSIVDKGVWFTVQRRFTDYFNEQQQRRRQTHDYLLTSILYCGVCGYRMRGLRNEKTYRNLYFCGSKEERWRSKKYDVCDKKKSKSVNIDRLDELVWNEVVGTIKDSSVLKEMKKKSILKDEGKRGEVLVKKQLREKTVEKKELEVKLQKFQNKRHQLMEWFMNDTVDEEQFNKLETTVEKNIWEVSGEIDEIDVYISRLHESKKWVDWYKIYMDDVKKWEKIKKVNDRKELLKQYLDRVIVKYDSDDKLHKVEMFLRLKLFNDKYKVTKDFERDSKGRILKGREYEVIDGESRKVMYLTETKVGRKKKRI
jgi:site-specific DNA recombinase